MMIGFRGACLAAVLALAASVPCPAIADALPGPPLTHVQKLALLRAKVKYVFVLFQENRSFDFYFGTFPGADGLFSRPAAQTPGFSQKIVNTDGTVATISPFLIPQAVTPGTGLAVPLYPADTESVDHSHAGMANSLDIDGNLAARNDRYALNEEGLTTQDGRIVSRTTGLPPEQKPTLIQKQRAELVMGHVDCDTVPFLWQYASRFVLFDDFHQTVIGPSTPNAIALIAAQSGETQWALHTDENGEPLTSDPGPFAGSDRDTAAIKPPYNPVHGHPQTPGANQTYASLPLSFMGGAIGRIVQSDENPAADLRDVQNDIGAIAASGLPPVRWGWYQEGYGHEPTDGAGPATHTSYVVHHNGPQYFGYVGDNPRAAAHMHGLADFYADIAYHALPKDGGVFYVRGGYRNIDGLKPLDPNPAVRARFLGDDDHPGYSDAQISEALLADEIDAIAASPYWADSAIIITYDETDGLYDHAQSRIRVRDAQGRPLEAGPRIPAIVISPYARAGAIVHDYAEQSAVIRFIEELHGLAPLADLPDEKRGRARGEALLGQSHLGPADGAGPDANDLFGAFDDGRLRGDTPPLPAASAEIPPAIAHTLPHDGGHGCTALHITPTDREGGRLLDPAPADFNPRPRLTPGIPLSGAWAP